MSDAKNKLLQTLRTETTGAPLTEQAKETAPTTQPKHLNALPTRLVKAHLKGKKDGITNLDLSNYIYEALREKLIKDGLL